MSRESTATYHSLINNLINARIGKDHSSKCLACSLDFQDFEELRYGASWVELETRRIDQAAEEHPRTTQGGASRLGFLGA